VRFACEGIERSFVVERNVSPQGLESDGAVHGATIEIQIAKHGGDAARHCAFAGTGRAIDGDSE
jgi:hypothetical protein